MLNIVGHLTLALFLLQKTGKHVDTLHAHFNSQQNFTQSENFDNFESHLIDDRSN